MAEQLIRLKIKSGSVFYYVEKTFVTSNEPHYFVVLNRNPSTDPFLVLVCITSHVQKVKKIWGHALNTLVEVGPKAYSKLKCPSIVNCNRYTPKTIEQLSFEAQTRILKHDDGIDESLLLLLRKALVASDQIEPKVKKLCL